MARARLPGDPVQRSFAQTDEMLVGSCLLEARDLKEAIQLAAGIPPAQHGRIELRPVRELQVAPG